MHLHAMCRLLFLELAVHHIPARYGTANSFRRGFA
jgi:hypothetical protein